ncbi:ferredoxin-type protein NapF [Phaeobacter gallaeciensis]|uniref:Ferredoxin-type protein NapF n=2 Tax=Roseobacteraceae TaxID=2854170 RepID=A0A366X748_9RHOB|nr:ferredoxin-type protein NapF [Falsiruegeria litorea]MBT8169853.1 ferredoxin-type protein NapF [Falsiruegeria litorea]RBW58466.1 ferredoxin-type protein NapF [Phaeobacter gallaeciensis]
MLRDAKIQKVGNVRPPHASEQAIRSHCTGCKDCISACPEAILVAGRGNTPFVDFNEGGCSFCGVCAEVCKEDIFDLEAAPWQHVALIGEGCFLNLGVACQSCTDACDTGALTFNFRHGPVGSIQANATSCTGCGACLSICPTKAIDLVPEKALAHV